MRHSTSAALAACFCSACAGMQSTAPAPMREGPPDVRLVAGASRTTPAISTQTSTSVRTNQEPPRPSDQLPPSEATLARTSGPLERHGPSESEVPAPTPADSQAPKPISGWGEGNATSYIIPATEILGFQILLNQYDRYYAVDDVYGTNLSTIGKNFHSGWYIDDDPFGTNQFLHPYQGSIYHGFARSAGLSYWESLAYDFLGSAVWEIAGETVPPSLNDQITTTFGGSFLGEALFRMATMLLESGGEHPSFLRSVGAALISPATGFNRAAFGKRFDALFPANEPPTYTRIGIGVRRNQKLQESGVQSDVSRDEIVGDFVMDYGMPGKATYHYTRPFDYFHFEVTAVSDTNALPEDVQVRGLLLGSEYEVGHSYRGIWGLYGGYDYISPEVFSVSSTSMSLGTTGQWWASDSLALQGTLLGGAGWTASGTIADAEVDRDYHYGVSPQGLGALRVIFGERAVLDMTGRAYYIGAIKAGASEDSETILRGKLALTVRVYGHHAIGIQYVASTRDARYNDFTDTNQSIAATSLFYTYISDTKFGAVEWR